MFPSPGTTYSEKPAYGWFFAFQLAGLSIKLRSMTHLMDSPVPVDIFCLMVLTFNAKQSGLVIRPQAFRFQYPDGYILP
ncbi:hypothetical protein [Dickeya zeae]|uniref:hypothetical protein n=1 Tax=Dickeya zeae TaxID=204042 RepID=UPI00209746E9|nr:hypothetical protein [Dickeya zeae]MCO7261669.1 hypothetical protein [Dickeya zeae]